jgi:hypothetical protein
MYRGRHDNLPPSASGSIHNSWRNTRVLLFRSIIKVATRFTNGSILKMDCTANSSSMFRDHTPQQRRKEERWMGCHAPSVSVSGCGEGVFASSPRRFPLSTANTRPRLTRPCGSYPLLLRLYRYLSRYVDYTTHPSPGSFVGSRRASRYALADFASPAFARGTQPRTPHPHDPLFRPFLRL